MLQKKEALLRKINKKEKKILPSDIQEPEEEDEPKYQPPVRANRNQQYQQQYQQQPQQPEYEPQIYRSPSIKPKTPPPKQKAPLPQQKIQETTFEEEDTVSHGSLTLHHFDFADIDESVQSPGKPILGGMDSVRHPHEDDEYENEGRVGKVKTKYKKPTGKPNLRAILWTMVLPGLLADNVKDLIQEHRTDIQEVMAENIHTTFQTAEEFLIKIGDKYLKSVRITEF